VPLINATFPDSFPMAPNRIGAGPRRVMADQDGCHGRYECSEGAARPYRRAMRFATYQYQGAERAGLVDGDLIRPLAEGTTVLGLIQAGALHTAEPDHNDQVPLNSVRLLPPLHPASIRDFVGFEAHIEGVARAQEGTGIPPAWYEAPAFYFTSPHAVIGAHDDVPMFPGSTAFDFECELATVIGKPGRNLTPEQARDHIVGYTLFGDWSARDIQRQESRLPFGFAKGKDGAHTLGPWLVTADELEPFRQADGYLDLTLTVELNGTMLAKDSLASMSWLLEEQVSYASRGSWIRPGDVLGSGTFGGGCLAEFWGRAGRREPPPLKPGDVVTYTAEGIGTIRNTVVPGTELPPVRPARPRPRTRKRTP
jgi:2-keto-4-pentenoate hydratase/2-oxohepta-3-ene-1,7-dioic acid hydratase in catechol pathway